MTFTDPRIAEQEQPEKSRPQVTVGEILAIFYRRRVVGIATLLLSIAIGAFFAVQPRKFVAVASIRVQPGQESLYRTSPAAILSGEVSDKIASEVRILQSRTLYLEVADELKLVDNPLFWPKSFSKRGGLSDALVRERMFRRLSKALSIDHNPKDEIVAISCKTVSPQLSAAIVNALINDYISYLFKLRVGSTQRSSGWLEGQLSDLKKQIDQDQVDLVQLQGKLGIIGFDEKETNYLASTALDSLSKASTEATIQRIVAEAKYRYLKESDPNLVEGEISLLSQNAGSQPMGLLQSLREARGQVASDYETLLSQFGANYPEVKRKKAQLDELDREVVTEQKRIINQASLAYSAAISNESMANNALDTRKQQAFSSHDDMVRYLLLLHDYESHRTLYEGLVQRLREAGITSGLEAGGVDIVDLADLPAIPSAPGPALILLLSLLAGTFIAAVVCVSVDILDDRIMTSGEALRASGMDILAYIPHLEPAQAERQIESLAHPQSQYTEAIQTLRSSLLLSHPGGLPRVILTTSSRPGEGKSTTALNLACILAQHNAKVLLIDCDLRRGTLAEKTGLSASPGLSSYISASDSVTLASILQAVPGIPGLNIITSGPAPPNPAVLLASNAMRELIAKIRERYDFVLLDSPPAVGLADVPNLSGFVDVALLIIRAGISRRASLVQGLAELRRARLPFAGFALNDYRRENESDAYGYGYNYGSYYKGEADKK